MSAAPIPDSSLPPTLVLTAGRATRLRPLSFCRAKAALPVGGVPLVERIVRDLVAAGARDLVLNLHHLPQSITTICGDGAHLGARIRYSWELPLLGSGGGPRRALPLLGASPFLIVNGDTLTDAHLPTLVAAHGASGAAVTMAVIPNREPHKYGGVLVDASGVVTGFVRAGHPGPSFHFIGVQVATTEAFAEAPDGVACESVGRLYPALIAQRPGAVRAWVTEATFFDIGTPADYLETSRHFSAQEHTSGTTGEQAWVAPSATVVESVLWDRVMVGDHASLTRCIVTDNVTIAPGTRWADVTIRLATSERADHEVVHGELAVTPIRPRS